jgi:hypothetical protein
LLAEPLDEGHIIASQLNHLVFSLVLVLDNAVVFHLGAFDVLPNALADSRVFNRSDVLNADGSAFFEVL